VDAGIVQPAEQPLRFGDADDVRRRRRSRDAGNADADEGMAEIIGQKSAAYRDTMRATVSARRAGWRTTMSLDGLSPPGVVVNHLEGVTVIPALSVRREGIESVVERALEKACDGADAR